MIWWRAGSPVPMNPHTGPGGGRLARRSVTLLAAVAAFVAVTVALTAAARSADPGTAPRVP